MRPNHDWSQQDVDARTSRPEGRNEPDAEHLDKMSDEALRETFPASDPIAITIDKPLKSCASEEHQGPDNRATSPRTTPALVSFYDANLWGINQIFDWWSLCSEAAVANNVWKRRAIE
jgi:hypothetical protein